MLETRGGGGGDWVNGVEKKGRVSVNQRAEGEADGKE